MIARLAGVALDARVLLRRDPRDRAAAARWIANNLLAARGVRAAEPVVRVDTFDELLVALARSPARVDAGELPWRWRLALRLLGMPMTNRRGELAV